MVLSLEADDRDRELKMKREHFACEGATDLGIKLFGCRIRASPEYRVPAKSEGGDRVPDDYGVAPECSEIIDVGRGKAGHACYSSVVRVKLEVASGEDVKKIHSNSREAEATDHEHEQANNFKKPEKILPCPRCNSLETKFCYFNNYNVNQPRHFCRNCQRYWTAGGTMRNVPVGAGRRKNKQLSFPYFQMVASPTLESTPAVLKFASETSMSESVETVLAVGDQNMSAENKEDSASCGSSMRAHGVRSHSHKDGTQFERLGQPSTCTNDDSSRSSGCGSVPACSVPLNQLWNNNAASLGAHYVTGPMLAVPGFALQTIPLQIVEAPYLGCISLEAASQGDVAPIGLWNGSSPNCSVLGKHPRDASFDCKDTENTIYAPRALKIDNFTDRSSLRPRTAVLSSKPEYDGP